MAPKRKNQSSTVVVISPIDPNSQLPFAGNHMSVVSESYLLHLVDVGVLPPKELCSWQICRGVTVPTEDTHESVVYVPFLIRCLALPISPFFRGILDFYNLNLTHLNTNSILQISIFVHLCEAYLGILPHFGLWKYLYHCRPRMAGGQHQLVGGASLEMHRGRKTEYVTEPPKSLGPPTVVLVQRTSDNPIGAPDHLTSSISKFLTFPRAFYPSHRHYKSSEMQKCGSSYNNLLLLKSKT
jgi:hypothetical protein